MIQCIKLPYKTRNVSQLKKLIASHIIRCGEQIVCFSIEQLVRKVYLCRANSLKIIWRSVEVYDKLSGLNQKLRQPGLKIDETIVWLKWDGTRFVLDAPMLQKLVEKGVCVEEVVA